MNSSGWMSLEPNQILETLSSIQVAMQLLLKTNGHGNSFLNPCRRWMGADVWQTLNWCSENSLFIIEARQSEWFQRKTDLGSRYLHYCPNISVRVDRTNLAAVVWLYTAADGLWIHTMRIDSWYFFPEYNCQSCCKAGMKWEQWRIQKRNYLL